MTEKIYQIESPPMQMDKLRGAVFQKMFNAPEIKAALIRSDEDYLHWEQLKYKNWIPQKSGLDKESFWTLVRIYRSISAIQTPIRDSKENFFKMNTHHYNRFLHIVDKEMAGNFMGIPGLSENDKRQFVTRSIIEESIASSQLEGANTSRTVAKKMLLEGRNPIDHSERMIVNTHRTMLRIEQELYKENLSWELISELHSMITDQTIPKEKQGILRETLDEQGNKLVIKPWDNRTIAYVAPDKEFVEFELPKLIDFANDKEEHSTPFIHPILKAIMIHFWIGLLHPFEDGNGRLARILFYWYVLKNDYWAFAYLSLSEKIKKSPKQYALAYIYSEQEDCDLTYFINYNINKIKLAQKDFQTYIVKKVKENQSIIILSQHEHSLNERQMRLLQYLNRKIENRTNIATHMKLYSIQKVTAINDLKDLVEKGYLLKRKQGRNVYYYPTEKIKSLLKFN
ncbi:TPA: Fic family protein [Legionella pneumophila]|nr:Fic family protein [Legionella pneumophila]